MAPSPDAAGQAESLGRHLRIDGAVVHGISEVSPLKGSEPGERCPPDSPSQPANCDPFRPESLLRHDCSAALVDGLVLSAPRQLPMSGGFQLLVGCRLQPARLCATGHLL